MVQVPLRTSLSSAEAIRRCEKCYTHSSKAEGEKYDEVLEVKNVVCYFRLTQGSPEVREKGWGKKCPLWLKTFMYCIYKIVF